MSKRLEELNILADKEDLWNDAELAQKTLKERAAVQEQLKIISVHEAQLADALALIELGEEADDAETLNEADALLEKLLAKIEKLQLESMLNGEADANGCFLEIHAGAGGTESCDWASILMRMYLRWVEERGFSAELMEETPGEEAGIKSVTFKIGGYRAFGWLKTETGVHRLVRISPFDSNARRHTSFASINIFPDIDDDIIVEIDEKDLKIDTYRASGAGGQHVNRTDSAVRITHLPTNIVVQCQNDRSQHKNKASAMKMLKSRIYEMELRKKEAVSQSSYENKTDIGWGHQIRSYVLHPYQMVKDLRTGYETGNTGAVLDGRIDGFLEAALAAKAGATRT